MTAHPCDTIPPAGAALVKVTGPTGLFRCVCGRVLLHQPDNPLQPAVYADTSGPAFKAYWCSVAAERHKGR